MQLNTTPTEPLLVSLAEEVRGLLGASEIDELADRFGYAARYNRDAALSRTQFHVAVTVQDFKPNDTKAV